MIVGSFKAKIGWKRLRERENKNYRSFKFLPDRLQKIPKKQQKKKNSIMASFQAKIGWKWLRMIENKNYISVMFLPDQLEKIPKKQQKNSKNFKIQLSHHFKPKQVGKG